MMVHETRMGLLHNLKCTSGKGGLAMPDLLSSGKRLDSMTAGVGEAPQKSANLLDGNIDDEKQCHQIKTAFQRP